VVARFDLRDIRRGMDVYDRDGDWLGAVLKVEGLVAEPPDALVATYPKSTNAFNGELIGPASTQLIGNSGPSFQTERTGYGVRALPDGRAGNIVVGRWYGLGGRRTIAADAIVNISLERIVVKAERDTSPSS
jgi:hypothetical protein